MRNLDQAAINIVETTRGCDLFLVKVKSLVEVFRTAVREMKLSVGEDYYNFKKLTDALLVFSNHYVRLVVEASQQSTRLIRGLNLSN